MKSKETANSSTKKSKKRLPRDEPNSSSLPRKKAKLAEDPTVDASLSKDPAECGGPKYLQQKKELTEHFNKRFPTFAAPGSNGEDDNRLVDLPLPGHTTINGDLVLYCTRSGETLGQITEKLGVESWQDIAGHPNNMLQYGILKASSTFYRGTILEIPPNYSKWAVNECLLQEDEDSEEKCTQCKSKGNPAQMLLCDLCNKPYHTACVGLDEVPEGDWFCEPCLEVLKARKEYYGKPQAFPEHSLCPAPALDGQKELQEAIGALRSNLEKYLDAKRRQSATGGIVEVPSTNRKKATPEYPLLYLGAVFLREHNDISALEKLEEWVVLVPITHSAHATTNKDDGDTLLLNGFELKTNRAYGAFARIHFFDKSRDDELPMVTKGVRDAQRHLFRLLTASEESNLTDHPLYKFNKHLVLSYPPCPATVETKCTRTTTDDHRMSKLFELVELVQDCNVSLDLPKEPTPASMVANGCNLHGYQQSSLRWMLDKEKEATGLGLAGELWHRLRFLEHNCHSDNTPKDFFYCELTGSFALDIFDFQSSSGQKNASRDRFGKPTGGILGEEMGLG
jgi:PHD-finger